MVYSFSLPDYNGYMKRNLIFLIVFVLFSILSKESFAQNITQSILREFRVTTGLRNSPMRNLTPTITPTGNSSHFPSLENYIYNRRGQFIKLAPVALNICDTSKPPYAPNIYVDMAVNDLSDRLGVKSDQIAVVSITPKDFGDTSLGCPQPGYFYIQVITPGYIIVLSYSGTPFTYHGGLSTVVHC